MTGTQIAFIVQLFFGYNEQNKRNQQIQRKPTVRNQREKIHEKKQRKAKHSSKRLI